LQVRRADEQVDGIIVADNLREMLVMGGEGGRGCGSDLGGGDCSNAELVPAAARDELLWRVFRALALGGPCCQYEVGG
jgi:hypothetical protein